MLLEHFNGNEDEAIRLMRAFASATLRFPPQQAVERLAREVQVRKALDRDPSTQTVRRLASIHGCEPRSVAKSYSRRTGHGITHTRKLRQRVSGKKFSQRKVCWGNRTRKHSLSLIPIQLCQ